MSAVNYLVSTVRRGLKQQSALIGKALGYTLLDKMQTEHLLNPYLIASADLGVVDLPQVDDCANPTKMLFDATEVTTSSTRVWQYEPVDSQARLLRSGGLKIGKAVLDTDFGTSAVFKDMLKTEKRATVDTETLIAPWSHYWGGYYDYLFFIAAKLCRIKDALPASQFNDALVSYPLLNTPFERDLLNLIGIRPENRIDSRSHKINFKMCVLGNNDSWFYPNYSDILSLKKHVMAGISATKGQAKRIYISRRGRRRILNEDALITLLSKYDIDVIEDKPRSIAEQISIYQNASFIIGPHGASFANVVWCRPKTHLVELFADGYKPAYFRYLAQINGLHYSAYCRGSVMADSNQYVDHRNVNNDITVALDHLERWLDERFKQEAVS